MLAGGRINDRSVLKSRLVASLFALPLIAERNASVEVV
jgi:hypothetical protein